MGAADNARSTSSGWIVHKRSFSSTWFSPVVVPWEVLYAESPISAAVNSWTPPTNRRGDLVNSLPDMYRCAGKGSTVRPTDRDSDSFCEVCSGIREVLPEDRQADGNG